MSEPEKEKEKEEDKKVEVRDGRFRETVSNEWAKIRTNPELYKAYMDRKKRYRERVKNGEVTPRKREGRTSMFVAATKKTQTRASIISEVMNKLYAIEWQPNEFPKIWTVMKDLSSLGFRI